MKLAFEPVWPWPLLILACLAMLGVVAMGYPRQVRHLPVLWQRILLGLRLALVALMTLWLLRPAAILESDDRSDASLYVVLDASGSMSTPDAPGGITRRAALLQLFEAAKPLLDELGDSLEVRIRDLSEGLVPVQTPPPEATGRLTTIGASLEDLAREATQEKIAAILFWSDGRQAAIGSSNVDPVQAARLLGRQHRPVYAVGFGSSEVSETTVDVSLSELDVARDVFIRNVVPIKVRFRGYGAEGRDVRLRVLVEQRGNLPNGESGPMSPIPLDADNVTVKTIRPTGRAEDLTVDLQFVPTEVGEIKIAVEAQPLDDEVRRTNNRVETVIRVRSGGIRVAYFDRIRPELKWLKRINVSSRVQLDAMPIRTGQFANRNEFNEDWFAPGNYDAFIIGDVPAAVFGDERLRRIYVCCEQGAGLMMIGGQNSFGAGGYQRTPLAGLLPIVMSDADEQLTDAVAMIPTRAALNNPILQIASPDQNSNRWNELPPLEGANVFRLKAGTAAQVLAESKTRMPLLVGQSTGSARVLVFAGDTTWQWAVREDWAVEAHQRFWRQVIFWLTKMENDGESPAWINVEPRDLNPGGRAELHFGLRDADGLPLANVNYDVTVQAPEGDPQKVPTREVDAHGAGEFQNTAQPGDYWVTVAAEGADGTLNYASTRFLVSQRDPELDNPAADPGLLRELAHVSGGDYLEADAMLARLQQWVSSGMPSLELKRSRRVTLWDNWYSLLLFVILMTLEWFLRKKRGLV
ncbi:MAG: glutamine amidotransferase [Fuerstiella sp.]